MGDIALIALAGALLLAWGAAGWRAWRDAPDFWRELWRGSEVEMAWCAVVLVTALAFWLMLWGLVE